MQIWILLLCFITVNVILTFVMHIINQFWPTTHNRKLWSQWTLDGLTVDCTGSWQNGKSLAVCSYDQMKSRASRTFSVLLGILLESSWSVRSGILHHSPWGKVPWRMKEMEFAIPTVCLRTSHDGSMILRLATWADYKCIWPYLGFKRNI